MCAHRITNTAVDGFVTHTTKKTRSFPEDMRISLHEQITGAAASMDAASHTVARQAELKQELRKALEDGNEEILLGKDREE